MAVRTLSHRSELARHEDALTTAANMEERLIYGSYPEVITTAGIERKQQLLHAIVDHSLLKDLFTLEYLKKPQKVLDLLKLIAFQIGHEVSVSELANSLNINFTTVERYLDLLTKVFVLVRVNGFSKNLRKEVTKNARYYFVDNGVRNAVINNFNALNARNDAGQLWENYVCIERMKKRAYAQSYANTYFWRTYDKKEIDLVEEREGKLFGYEITWQKGRSKKPPKDWLATYANAEYRLINRDNYLEFIV